MRWPAVTTPDVVERRYRRLFDRYHPHVLAYCRRRAGLEGAADAAAETFLVAWRRIEDVPDGDAALWWLYGVARRVLANSFRSDRRRLDLVRRLRLNQRKAPVAPETVVVRREQDEQVLAAMARLGSDDQEVLRLALWEEVPHAVIAEILGCSVPAVTQRVYRATRRVAAEYRRLDGEAAGVMDRGRVRGGETA